jgi:hypothetical protein
MADEPDYGVRIATWLARALGDSVPFFEQFTTEELGVDLPAAVVQVQARTSMPRCSRPRPVLVTWAAREPRSQTAASSGDDAGTLTAYLGLGSALSTFYAALNELEDAIDDNVTPATVPNAAERAGGRGLRRETRQGD